MAISWGNIAAQGILGAVGGFAAGGAKAAEMEMKEEMERVKEERLSKLRAQEHATNRQFDLDAAKKMQDEERKNAADFYSRTADAAPGKTINEQATATFETDAGPQSVTSNTESTKLPPTARELASYRKQEAYKTGNEKLITQTLKEDEDLRKEDEQRRKDAGEERRTRAAENVAATQSKANELREREIERKEAADKNRRDYLTRKLAGGNGSDLKERQFDVKQWSAAKKGLNENIVLTSDIPGDKAKPDFAARSAATIGMNKIQNAGDVDPEVAAAAMGEIVDRAQRNAREASKGDQAKYEKLVRAGIEFETSKLLQGAGKPADVSAPAAPAAPAAKGVIDSRAPLPAPAAPKPPPSPDDPLRKATPAQLWKAVENPQTKQFAIEELRRRGLVPPEADTPTGADSRFNPA